METSRLEERREQKRLYAKCLGSTASRVARAVAVGRRGDEGRWEDWRKGTSRGGERVKYLQSSHTSSRGGRGGGCGGLACERMQCLAFAAGVSLRGHVGLGCGEEWGGVGAREGQSSPSLPSASTGVFSMSDVVFINTFKESSTLSTAGLTSPRLHSTRPSVQLHRTVRYRHVACNSQCPSPSVQP